jgi:DNA-binding CsgD family transcriptional regulator
VVANQELTMADARLALEFAVAIAECADEAQLAARVEALAGLTGADGVIVIGTRDWMGDVVVEVGDPGVYQATLLEAVGRDWRDHPLMGPDLTVADGGVRRLSDFVATREWRRRGLFNEFYRPLGMTNEVSVQLAWGPAGSSCCVALHRSGRDFDTRELALLELLAPHLRAARGRLAVKSRPVARVPALDDGHTAASLARRLPITPREAEVLAHLAAGRTNEGIADELTISRHTVVRHVEHIYAKLGVHTRAAATREALRALYEER